MKHFSLLLLLLSLSFASDAVEEKLASLQEQIDALKSSKQEEDSAYKLSFPGQYRINFYSVENDIATQETQNAARMRIRQNVDITFSDQLSSSVRLQLNHTNDSITNAQDTSNNDVQIRHGYITYAPRKEFKIRAGLVPVIEYHHDLLYSKGWGYNPLALEGFADFEGIGFHGFITSLKENDETTQQGDMNHYQADISLKPSSEFALTFSGTLLEIDEIAYSGKHVNMACKLSYKPSQKIVFDLDLLYSYSQKGLFAHGQNAKGFAVVSKFAYKEDGFESLLLLTHTQGDEEGAGFLVPMSFTKTNSYWGYTGIVTVMPQTDTGFDGDSVHVSNNGYGMSSLQANMRYTINQTTKIYAALGWFGDTNVAQRSNNVALDSVVMTQFMLHEYLGLDVGVGYARIYDSLSGYNKGVIGNSATFTNEQDQPRDKVALYGRLQLEF